MIQTWRVFLTGTLLAFPCNGIICPILHPHSPLVGHAAYMQTLCGLCFSVDHRCDRAKISLAFLKIGSLFASTGVPVQRSSMLTRLAGCSAAWLILRAAVVRLVMQLLSLTFLSFFFLSDVSPLCCKMSITNLCTKMLSATWWTFLPLVPERSLCQLKSNYPRMHSLQCVSLWCKPLVFGLPTKEVRPNCDALTVLVEIWGL